MVRNFSIIKRISSIQKSSKTLLENYGESAEYSESLPDRPVISSIIELELTNVRNFIDTHV
jgi:hypothetical protein